MKADKRLKLRGKRKKIVDKINASNTRSETKSAYSAHPKKRKIFFRVLFSVLAISLFLFLVLNINYLTPGKMKEHIGAVFADTGHGAGFPYRFSSNEIKDFSSFYSNDIVILTDSDLMILNRSAKPVLTYKHSMSNPIMKCSRDRILLYDQGASKAVILNQKGVVIDFPVDAKIICADICNNGKTAIVTRNDSKKEFLNVYAYSGKRIMNWQKGAGYIIDTTLSENGNYVGVAILDTEDAVQTVTILNFTVSNAKQKGNTKIKSSTFYGMDFLSSNDLAVLCDNKIFVFNSKCEGKKDLEINASNSLQLYTDNRGQIIHTYSLFNNGTYSVDVYNSNLKKIYSKECKQDIITTGSDGKSIYVLYTNKNVELNMIGGKVTYLAKPDNLGSFAAIKGKNIYVCSNGCIEKVKAKKQ